MDSLMCRLTIKQTDWILIKLTGRKEKIFKFKEIYTRLN